LDTDDAITASAALIMIAIGCGQAVALPGALQH
jgi:hypothetical protein